MADQRQQPGSAPGAAALDGSDGDVEDAGRFGDGVALHVDEDECRPLLRWELGECGDELTVEILALGGYGGGLVRLQELFQALGFGDGRGTATGRLARAVQAGVHGDAVQPGGDGGPALEGVGTPVGGDQGVLDGVGGFLPVPQNTQGDGPEPVAVAAYDLTEGVRIAGDMASEEFPVVDSAGTVGTVRSPGVVDGAARHLVAHPPIPSSVRCLHGWQVS
jgi:hypothetical protein